MAEEIVLNVSVNADPSIKEVKDLKKQFAEAEDAVFKLAGAGKKNTEEFRKASLEAAALKQEVDNINTSLDDLKPEAKLAAFGKVTAGLASGFAAATGAAALFGDESEDLQKTLVKVQAAMAFAEGIRGLKDLSEGFKLLKAVILANPLFLIASVLIAIGTAMFALKDKIKIVGAAFDAMGKVLDFIIKKTKEFTDAVGLSNFALEEQREKLLALNEMRGVQSEKAYDKQIRAARRAEKATEELEIRKIETLKKLNAERIKLLDSSNEEERDQIRELQAANEEFTEKILDLQAARTKRLKSEHAKRLEIEKEALEERKRLNDDMEDDLELDEGDIDPRVKRWQDQTKALKEELEERRITTEEDDLRRLELEEAKAIKDLEDRFSEVQQDEEFARLKLGIEEEFQKEKTRIENEQLEKQKAERLQAAQESIDLNQNRLTTIQGLSDSFFAIRKKNLEEGSKEEEKVARRQFNINKALQIGQAAINGAQAVVKGIAQFGPPPSPAGIAAIAAAAAATAASISKISSTKFESTASATAPSIPSVDIPTLTPQQDVSTPGVPLGQVGETLLNPDGTVKGQEKQAIIKAFVVETDITSSQNNVKDIEEKASFG